MVFIMGITISRAIELIEEIQDKDYNRNPDLSEILRILYDVED